MRITISKRYDVMFTLRNKTNYVFSQDGKCFNLHRGTQMKRIMNGNSVGYSINGKFQSLSSLRKELVKIEKSEIPF